MHYVNIDDPRLQFSTINARLRTVSYITLAAQVHVTRFFFLFFFLFTGKRVTGEYIIKEPGGNTRTVTYHVDPHGGFFARVHNSGGNNHHGGTYGGHGHEYH